MNKLLKSVLLCVVAVLGYQWYSISQLEKFVKEKRTEFSGYRIEYFERERLLFVHSPDGTKEGLDLSDVISISLYRLNDSDGPINPYNFSWLFMSKRQMPFEIPFFSEDPSLILSILKKEFPEIDVEKSLKRSKEFEHKKFNFCPIWMPAGEKQMGAEKGYSVCSL